MGKAKITITSRPRRKSQPYIEMFHVLTVSRSRSTCCRLSDSMLTQDGPSWPRMSSTVLKFRIGTLSLVFWRETWRVWRTAVAGARYSIGCVSQAGVGTKAPCTPEARRRREFIPDSAHDHILELIPIKPSRFTGIQIRYPKDRKGQANSHDLAGRPVRLVG